MSDPRGNRESDSDRFRRLFRDGTAAGKASYLLDAECGSSLYWFDAGESSFYTAHLGDWPQGADLMMMETGHHDPLELCEFFRSRFSPCPKTLLFLHHGGKILDNPSGYREECAKHYPGRVIVAEDNMKIPLTAEKPC